MALAAFLTSRRIFWTLVLFRTPWSFSVMTDSSKR